MAEGPGGLESDPEGYSSNKRRWSHLFHTSIYRTVGHKEYTYAPNWKSLCEPASLPITTDYKPTPSELNTRFAEGNHTLNADDAGPYRSRTEELLRELVSQRLVQGYQLVVPPKPRKDLLLLLPPLNKPPPPPPQLQQAQLQFLQQKPTAAKDKVGSAAAEKSVYTVSMGNDYHEFGKEGQNIRVKRYHKKDDRRIRTGGAGIVYSYQLMGLGEERWAPMKVSFNHKASAQYSWNYLDQLICGYSDDMYDTLKYSTVKYVLAPIQSADVEERTVRSFLAFAKALAAKDDKESKLNVQILSKFALLDESESKERTARVKPDDWERLVGMMRHPIGGLTPLIRDRRWRFRNYKSCFVGSDCVEWLLKAVDVDNRRAAEELGQRLLDTGVIEHVAGKTQFKDGNYYYRLREDPPAPVPAATAAGKVESPLKEPSPTSAHRSTSLLKKQLTELISAPGSASSMPPRSNTLDTSSATGPLLDQVAAGAPSPSPSSRAEKEPPTHFLKIEIPPTKTDRYEWLYMIYDGLYNPYEWFHVEFQWLVCTGCVVDDLLSMLERKAKNLGLRWIPIPVYLMDRSKKTNGFMGAFEISVACSVRDAATMLILQQEILSLCDFLLDKASGDQYYIHKTGMLFAQITHEGFLCALNTLPGARHKLSKGIKMLQYLRDFCSDTEQVEALLGQLLNPRASPRSYDDRDDEPESETDGEDFEGLQRSGASRPPTMTVPDTTSSTKRAHSPPVRISSSPGPLPPAVIPTSSSRSWLPATSPSSSPSSRHAPPAPLLPTSSPTGLASPARFRTHHEEEEGEGYNALLYHFLYGHANTARSPPPEPAAGSQHPHFFPARWSRLNSLPFGPAQPATP